MLKHIKDQCWFHQTRLSRSIIEIKVLVHALILPIIINSFKADWTISLSLLDKTSSCSKWFGKQTRLLSIVNASTLGIYLNQNFNPNNNERKRKHTVFPSTILGFWPISQHAEVNKCKSNVDDGQHRWKKSTLHELIIT